MKIPKVEKKQEKSVRVFECKIEKRKKKKKNSRLKYNNRTELKDLLHPRLQF